MEKKTMGTFLAALRKASGMTQKQLAEKLNVSDKAVSRWERDENAPDLSLIPVIAEVFGITSDELLRGERATADTSPDRAAAKAEKQVRRILKSTLTKYKIRSAVSVTVVLVGLIAAMIVNLGLLRAYIGFMTGCIFFVVAALCQTIFLILGRSALEQEEYEDETTRPCRKALTYGAELVYGFIYLLFAACLPLMLLARDTYMGLSAGSWLQYGLIFGLLSLPLIFAVCTAVNLKLGYWTTEKFKTPLGRLRVRCAAMALALIALLGVGQILLSWYLSENRHVLVPSYVFHNWEDFKTLMETPLDVGGDPLTYKDGYTANDTMYLIYENEEGTVFNYRYDEILTELYAHAEDEEKGIAPVVTYRNLNRYISCMEFSGDGDLLPVHVFTRDAVYEANRKAEQVLMIYCALYLCPILGTFLYYKKRKKETAAS